VFTFSKPVNPAAINFANISQAYFFTIVGNPPITSSNQPLVLLGTPTFDSTNTRMTLMVTNVPVTPKGCWPYWSDHYRDRGEPAVLVGLLNDLGHRIPFDRKRMYVTGMSSGGAMTTALAAAMLVGGGFLISDPVRPVERMLRSLFIWAGVWLMIGLFLEPFEGGIHKVPDNLTYYFTVTGTTSMLLVSLTAIIDFLGRRKWVSILIDVGHNPLLLYVLFTILINPLLELIPPLRGVLTDSNAQALVRSAIEVVMVVVIVRAMSRKRIYWRT